MAEMKNSECTDYKTKLLKALVSKRCNGKRVKVGKYGHDCACVVKNHFEGKLCDVCLLDPYHGKKHKCNTPMITKAKYPNLNGEVAEQLWSRLEKLHPTITHLSRSHYRFFLKHCCAWRDAFVKKDMKSDVCPAISVRRAMKRKFG